MVKSLSYLLLFSSFSVFSQSYQDQIQSFENQLESVDATSTEYIDILNDLSYAYRRTFPTKMDSLSIIALKKAKEINYHRGLAVAHKNRGTALSKIGDNREDIVHHYTKAIHYAKLSNDIYTEAACNNNLGLTYSYTQQHHLALQYLFKALNLHQAHLESDKLRALIYANIARSYLALDNFENSNKYFEASDKIAKRINNPNISLIYVDEYTKTQIKLNKYDKALELIKASIPKMLDAGDNQSYVQSNIVLAQIYLHNKDYEHALGILKTIKENSIKYTFEPELCKINLLLAEIALNNKAYASAKQLCQDVLNCPTSAENIENKIQANNILFNTSMASHQYKQAEKIKNVLDNLADERFDIFKKNQFKDMDALVDYEKNQAEIIHLRKDQEHQKMKFLFLLTATFIVTFLLLLLAQLYLKGKSNAISLQENYNQLQKTELNLKQKNLQLHSYIESNQLLERFAHVAAHDLKAPARTVSAYSGLIRQKLKGSITGDTKLYLNFIESSAKKMSQLIEDLLNYSKVKSKKLNIETVDLSHLIDSALTSLNANIKDENALINFNKLELIAEVDAIKIEQVFQNIIANALKFTKENKSPIVNINMIDCEHHALITIGDKGIGISETQTQKIFDQFHRLHPDKYQGSGIGLALCKNFIELHKGAINVTSQLDEGSSFEILIPKRFWKHQSPIAQ